MERKELHREGVLLARIYGGTENITERQMQEFFLESVPSYQCGNRTDKSVSSNFVCSYIQTLMNKMYERYCTTFGTDMVAPVVDKKFIANWMNELDVWEPLFHARIGTCEPGNICINTMISTRGAEYLMVKTGPSEFLHTALERMFGEHLFTEHINGYSHEEQKRILEAYVLQQSFEDLNRYAIYSEIISRIGRRKESSLDRMLTFYNYSFDTRWMMYTDALSSMHGSSLLVPMLKYQDYIVCKTDDNTKRLRWFETTEEDLGKKGVKVVNKLTFNKQISTAKRCF